MVKRYEIPPIPPGEATPLVKALVEVIERLLEDNQALVETHQQMRDEIALLKGEKAKPKLKPSNMDKEAGKKDDPLAADEDQKKRPGSAKRNKTEHLTIHEERVIPPSEPLPPGARFKGYRDVVVQELKITSHNTRYRLEYWQTEEGQSFVGRLPENLQGQHYGPDLRSYILYQHHHCHVTQPLLREQLTEWGIDISAGQIDALLTAGKEDFFAEKDALLVTGLEVCRAITVDDSGARHRGKNGYVTHLGHDLFGWFSSTDSKSRINFLELLHAGSIAYRITGDSLNYLRVQGLAKAVCQRLQNHTPGELITKADWQQHLDALDIHSARHRRLATEGALMGSLLEKGFNPNLAIISDGAGQFAIFLHGLCWIHAERLVHKLIPMNALQREDIERVRGQIWDFYADLKAYRQQPDTARIPELTSRFTAIFTQQTTYATLNQTLQRIHSHRDEMLLVLQRPDVPLHTNGSETDIRDYVKKRKVSGGTRSDLGRKCRDTFASLKITCRKLGLSFWEYLTDRESKTNHLPPLADILRQQACSGASP
jgi:hypothetical protein